VEGETEDEQAAMEKAAKAEDSAAGGDGAEPGEEGATGS
jgi:hypothetical protein